MKISKPFLMVSLALLVVWTVWSVQGSNLVPQTWLPEGTFFPNAFAQELPPRSSSTSIWAYKIKSGGGGLLTLNKSFYGYFWDTSGRIKNITAPHGLANLSYTFGATTLHIYFGYDNAKNNNDWKIGDDDTTRMMYGASINYRVTDFFSVVPVLTYYDWGKQADVATKPDINKEWIGGLQFRFVF